MKRLLVFVCLFAGCTRSKLCGDAVRVAHVLGCNDRECEVIILEGAIIRVPPDQAIVGSTVCLDKR